MWAEPPHLTSRHLQSGRAASTPHASLGGAGRRQPVATAPLQDGTEQDVLPEGTQIGSRLLKTFFYQSVVAGALSVAVVCRRSVVETAEADGLRKVNPGRSLSPSARRAAHSAGGPSDCTTAV